VIMFGKSALSIWVRLVGRFKIAEWGGGVMEGRNGIATYAIDADD
jgi:hypothetical protein